MFFFFFFFFKQKTAYEIRKGDWSSDVCSSDLRPHRRPGAGRRDGPLVLTDGGDPRLDRPNQWGQRGWDDARGRPRRRDVPPPGTDQHASVVRALDRAVPLFPTLARVALLHRRRDALVHELRGGAGADPVVGVARRV